MSSTGGSEVKASACNVGHLGSIPGSGRSPGEGNGIYAIYIYIYKDWKTARVRKKAKVDFHLRYKGPDHF